MNLIEMAKDLLNIKQNFKYYLDNKKLYELGHEQVYDEDFSIHIFEQMWGNTSGGFEGIGGSAMTTQTTYVLISNMPNYDECLVFFNGGFAYKVPYSEKFMKDVINQRIAGKGSYGKYINAK